MKKVLNITNGGCAVEVMKTGGIEGDFLPWNDVLHVGPVPNGLNLPALSAVRAEYGCQRGWGECTKVHQDFIDRDHLIKDFHYFDHIKLWFEHDLYDQLQLLQLLDWFYTQDLTSVSLSLICIDRYLGHLDARGINELQQYEQPVTLAMLSLGQKAWQAFRQPDPLTWYAMIESDTSVLPFLKGSIVRMLEEYPAIDTGLSLTEHKILNLLNQQDFPAQRLFEDYQSSEDPMFMGDLTFFNILAGLCSAPNPLVLANPAAAINPGNIRQFHFSITTQGYDVLFGHAKHTHINTVDRWIGGVHLHADHYWYWDESKRSVVKEH